MAKRSRLLCGRSSSRVECAVHLQLGYERVETLVTEDHAALEHQRIGVERIASWVYRDNGLLTPDPNRSDVHFSNMSEFFARQVLGSVNYRTGTERLDYLQAYLNYQIEHHLFPDIPMLKYREIAPRVKEACERAGLRYLQEPLGRRVRKLVDIMVGDASMRRVQSVTNRARVVGSGVRPAPRLPTGASLDEHPLKEPA